MTTSWLGKLGHPAAGAGILALVVTALYGSTLVGLVKEWWEDPNYSHGFVVPLFSAFLIWQRRYAIATTPLAARSAGLVVVVAGVGLLLAAEVGSALFLVRMSLVVVLGGLVLFHLGWRMLRVMLFPLAFLVFMIPLPGLVHNAMALPLQRLAAANAAAALDLIGVPVLLDGNVIQLSRLRLGVTEACSGIRSLISLLALAVAWAYLSLPTARAMVPLIVAAVPITIAANAARIVATGLVGHWFGAHYAEGLFHELAGWLIFVFALGGLLAVHAALTLVRRLSSEASARPAT